MAASDSNVTLHLTTFNCGRELVHVDYFAASLASSLPTLPPDLLVLCLQEIAPIGLSFLGGRFLAPYWGRLLQAVGSGSKWKYHTEEDEAIYQTVIMRNVGLTGLVVFAKNSMNSQIEWIEEAGTGCGVWEMGNKGAVGARIKFAHVEVPFTFVAAHLAPMEGAWEERNRDWKRICQTLVFEEMKVNNSVKNIDGGDGEEEESLLPAPSQDGTPGHHTLFHPPSHLFFAGDLNYRTADTPPDASKDFESWPHPLSSQSNEEVFKSLFASDQLTRELRRETTLHSLTEANIAFPPTYKYSSAAQTFASDSSQTIITALKEDEKAREETFPGLQMESVAGQNWVWAKHRIPSWCDRILYSNNAIPKEVKLYSALPVQPTSDHRPVVLLADVSRKTAVEVSEASKLFKIQPEWKAARAMARRYEFMVGLGAYLTLTGEGETLLAGSCVGIVGGYLVLSALLGQT